MTATATRALKIALHLAQFLEDADIDDAGVDLGDEHYSAADLRSEFERGLSSLGQGPRIYNDIDVQQLIGREIDKCGSAAELARRMGVSRQYLYSVYAAFKPPSPAVVAYFGLRRKGGMTLYERVDG